jgi:hypothetical protein
MKDLQEATAKICELKGENLALLALLACLVKASSPYERKAFPDAFERELESARIEWLNSDVSEHVSIGLENMATAIHSLLASQSRN